MDSAAKSQQNEKLWVEIDRAEQVDDPDEQKQAVESLAVAIGEAIDRRPGADLFFMLGYAWYLHPHRLKSAAIQENLERALNSALALDSLYAPAHMYLGHDAFDRGKHEGAQSHFERVDLGQLSAYWAMKVREMRVCCAIALHGLSSSLERLDEFVRIAEQHEPFDVLPTEIDKWVDGQRHQLNEPEEKGLREIWYRLAQAQRLRKDWQL